MTDQLNTERAVLAIMTAIVSTGGYVSSGPYPPNEAAERALELYESAMDALESKAGLDRDIERLEAAAAELVDDYADGTDLHESLEELKAAVRPFRETERMIREYFEKMKP